MFSADFQVLFDQQFSLFSLSMTATQNFFRRFESNFINKLKKNTRLISLAMTVFSTRCNQHCFSSLTNTSLAARSKRPGIEIAILFLFLSHVAKPV